MQLTNDLADQAAIEKALLISFERYQGALEANEPGYMVMQLEAMNHYADLMVENNAQLQQTINEVIAQIESNEAVSETSLLELQERLALEGFTPEEEQSLRDLGLNDEDLEVYRQFLLSLDFDNALSDLHDLKKVSQNRAESATTLSNQASEVVDFLSQNTPPEPEPVPEFTTIAIPVAAIIGLLVLFRRRNTK